MLILHSEPEVHNITIRTKCFFPSTPILPASFAAASEHLHEPQMSFQTTKLHKIWQKNKQTSPEV